MDHAKYKVDKYLRFTVLIERQLYFGKTCKTLLKFLLALVSDCLKLFELILEKGF